MGAGERSFPPSPMASYETFYNGDITLQCKNGTFPFFQKAYVDSLDKAVLAGQISHEDAATKIKIAEACWEKHKDTPEAQAGFAAFLQEKGAKEAAIITAAQNQLEELRGNPVTLVETHDVPAPGSIPDSIEISLEAPKRKRGRPKQS